MNADKAPLISKLILIVLVLILGCLVVLIVQQGQRAPLAREAPPEMSGLTEEPPPAGEVRPDYLPLTNRTIARRGAPNLARPALVELQQPVPGEIAPVLPPAVDLQLKPSPPAARV